MLGVIRKNFSVTEVPRKFGVSRQTVHAWMRRYEQKELLGLEDRTSRPARSPNRCLDEYVDATYRSLKNEREAVVIRGPTRGDCLPRCRTRLGRCTQVRMPHRTSVPCCCSRGRRKMRSTSRCGTLLIGNPQGCTASLAGSTTPRRHAGG
ncbi:MAG TPA: leucine zipper domain-containing protein [Acidimicrobiales bacterium]|nr:leucine zipper domain-containing protein [Acidimicrobiales bacterium]